jgi:cbb3-type cytochrome oxidase subunit 1
MCFRSDSLFSYDDAIVRKFLSRRSSGDSSGFLVGVLIALQLALPDL